MTNHVLGVLARMPAERLPVVIERLTADGDWLGRAVAYGRRYQFDHQPQSLVNALTDLDGAPGSTADRSMAARFLATRVIEATLIGQRVGAARVIRMLADAEDDPDDPGVLAVLRAMAYGAAALADEPGTDPETALARLDGISAPQDTAYAALWPGLRDSLMVRIATDRQDLSLMPDLSGQAPRMKADPRFGPAHQPVLELGELMGEIMTALQRQDRVALAAANARLQAALERLPAGDPTVDALRAQLATLMAQVR